MSNVLFGLFSGPDHAAAITGPSYLDRALEMLLEAKFRTLDKEDRTRMFDGSKGGILGTASAKIRLAYTMDMVNSDIYHDLLLINDIRNVFAHTLHPCNFDNALVIEDCSKLKLDAYSKYGSLVGVDGATAKGKYILSILLIYEMLSKKLRPLIMAKLLRERDPTAGLAPSLDE